MVAKNSFKHVGILSSTLLKDAIDPEGSLLDLYITGFSGIVGIWERGPSLAGPWTPIGNPTLIDPIQVSRNEFIRFLPNKNLTGYASINYKALDGSFYSSETETAWVPVGINSPRYNSNAHVILSGTKEDTLSPVSSASSSAIGLLSTQFAPKTKLGLAVTGLSGTGIWQVLIGRSWQPIQNVSEYTARLLRPTDRIRFVPASDWFGEATITYRAWRLPTTGVTPTVGNIFDGSGSYSEERLSASVLVNPVNDVPVINQSLPRIVDSEPKSVVNLLEGTHDRDGIVRGIAITQAIAKNGFWEYRPNQDVLFKRIGSVSSIRSLILDKNAEIRFVPNIGVLVAYGTLDYKVWDNSTVYYSEDRKSTTSTAFSKTVERATFSIGNTSPNFNPGTDPKFPNTSVTRKPVSYAVSSLLGRMTDTRGSLRGIAVTGLTGEGVWEFSLDAGRTWQAINDIFFQSIVFKK